MRIYTITKEMKQNPILSFLYLDSTISSDNKNKKWTPISLIKLILNVLLILIFLSLGILKCVNDKYIDILECLSSNEDYSKYILPPYYFFSSFIFLISTILYYKEFRSYRNQSWNGLRFLWFTHGIISITILITTLIEIFIKNYSFQIEDITFIIIFIISFILLFFSIFRPYDFVCIPAEDAEHSKKNSLLKNMKEGDELMDSFDSSEESNGGVFIKFDDYKKRANKISINFYLKIKTVNFKTLVFEVNIENIKFNQNKTPRQVSNFNESILKIYKQNKYSNDIINMIQQAYNISLTLDPQRSSFKNDKNSLLTLRKLYNEIIKISNNFLIDFLTFLEMCNNNLVSILNESNFFSVFDKNPDLLNNINNDNSIRNIKNITQEKNENNSNNSPYIMPSSLSKSAQNSSNNSLLYPGSLIMKSHISGGIQQVSRDMIKLYNFFNNVIINDNFISFNIIKLNDLKNVFECEIILKDNNERIKLELNREVLGDVIYSIELKSFYNDNLDKGNFKILNKLFNSYLNNLIYYDDELFNVFQFAKLLRLDIEKFDEKIVNNFFELNNISIQNNNNNISLFIFDIKLSIPSIDEIKNSNFSFDYKMNAINKNLIIGNNEHTFQGKINILKLYVVINDILSDINNVNKMNLVKLKSTLLELKSYILKIISIGVSQSEENIQNIINNSYIEYDKNKIDLLLFDEKKYTWLTESIENAIKNVTEEENLGNEKYSKISSEYENIGQILKKLLNNKNLKFILFFDNFRKIFGVCNLF